ncbi:glycosyltransferase family 9 protein [Persicitalea sp.]|uniref:glycosyltransferase family 9 protein n=1 Tax=Persicitalea sp. TaxID=3100273 RepID=UPI003594809C
MTPKAFVALWTHRYHKYSHIAKAHLLARRAQLYFGSKKRKLKKKLVAVVRTEHFGDIVAAEPLSRQIRELHPDAHIVWFVKPMFRELVDTNPNVDESFPEFCVTQRRVLLETGVFDKVYELQFRNNNRCPTCDVFVENPVAVAKGINVHTYFNFGNLLEVFAKISNLTVPQDDQPRLYLQERHRRKVDGLDLPKRFIVVHCLSNLALKDWPAERWNALIPQLADKYGVSIIEIGLSSNLSVNHPTYHNLCGQLSILETAEVIRRAEFFIGLDSGPAHLANAVGTFGFIILGSLNEFSAYNPYSGTYDSGENCVLIRREGVPCVQLPLETVLNAIEKKIPVSAKG